jgi:prepilin-type N-terminal cleavage/methylation domain-containing protein
MKKQKGFTIIELIVVIAIIAVLASIVLVNVTSYINKGKDSAARGNLSNMLVKYTVWVDGGGTASTFLSAATGGANYTTALITAGYTPATGTATALGWCASVPLKSPANITYFCVDSSGAKKESGAANCSGAAIACP